MLTQNSTSHTIKTPLHNSSKSYSKKSPVFTGLFFVCFIYLLNKSAFSSD
ncbi:hypothetical protein [uncultured Gammaproteobacteria bacterium]|nr:hypothetical protein [uncultured Gammaproteobacteria bacterium]